MKINDIASLIKPIIDNNKEFRMPIKGTSMIPFLYEKNSEVGLVKPLNLQKGDIVFYKRECGQYVLHRIHKIDKTNFTIIGDHQTILESGIKKDQIIAKVIHCYKNGQLINTNSMYYKFKIKIWHNLFIRKIMLRLCGGLYEKK